MFAIPGVVALVLLVYLHPQDIFERLRLIPLMNYAFGATALGWVLDLRLRVSRFHLTPLIAWSALLFLWSLITLAVHDAGKLSDAAVFLSVPFMLFFITAQGAQTFRSIQTVTAVLLGVALFIAVLGIHQRFAPTGCFGYQLSAPSFTAAFDGRPCELIRDCEPGEPGYTYFCEHVGLLGTYSNAMRVRYLGFLNDPNEVAMALSMCVPFAFAFFLLRRNGLRLALLIVTLVLVVTCNIFTQSRGGQLVFMAVNAVYFIRRYGATRGAIIGGILSLPLLLLSGRNAEEAAESSHDRIELLSTAMELFRSNPLFGVGYSNFGEYSSHAAHNSYATVAAEGGFPGLLIWNTLMYLGVKSTWLVMKRYHGKPEAEVAYVWSGALFAAQIGLLVGILFLTYNYSPILWVFLGVSAAFYSAVRRHDPEYRVTLTWQDGRRIVFGSAVFVVALLIYTRLSVS